MPSPNNPERFSHSPASSTTNPPPQGQRVRRRPRSARRGWEEFQGKKRRSGPWQEPDPRRKRNKTQHDEHQTLRKQPIVSLRRRTCSAPGMAWLGKRGLALVRSLRRLCIRFAFGRFHAATAAQHSPYRVYTSHHAANMARVPRLGLENSTHARLMSCLRPLPTPKQLRSIRYRGFVRLPKTSHSRNTATFSDVLQKHPFD